MNVFEESLSVSLYDLMMKKNGSLSLSLLYQPLFDFFRVWGGNVKSVLEVF